MSIYGGGGGGGWKAKWSPWGITTAAAVMICKQQNETSNIISWLNYIRLLNVHSLYHSFDRRTVLCLNENSRALTANDIQVLSCQLRVTVT